MHPREVARELRRFGEVKMYDSHLHGRFFVLTNRRKASKGEQHPLVMAENLLRARGLNVRRRGPNLLVDESEQSAKGPRFHLAVPSPSEDFHEIYQRLSGMRGGAPTVLYDHPAQVAAQEIQRMRGVKTLLKGPPENVDSEIVFECRTADAHKSVARHLLDLRSHGIDFNLREIPGNAIVVPRFGGVRGKERELANYGLFYQMLRRLGARQSR
jgi:hypothetical protein